MYYIDLKTIVFYRTFNSSSASDSSAMDHVETYDLNSNIWSNDSEKWYRNDGKYNREKLTELGQKVSALPYIPEELFSQNHNSIVWNKFIKYEDNQLKEIEFDGISFMKIAIPSGAKTLFISASENYFPVSYGCIFVNSNNTFISSGVWNSQLVDTSAIMPENIPDGAAFVYINYFINKSSSIKVYCGLPFVEKDNLIIPGELSELADFELFDKNNILNKINGYIKDNLIFVANNSLYVSSPVKCYSGDIFKISGWCGVDYQPSAYSRNVLLFNSNGGCIGVETIREEEFEYIIPNNVEYVSFLFEKNSQNNFSFKRVKSGRLNSAVPSVEPMSFDNDNLDVTSLKINNKNYNLRDASLLNVDNNLLKNATWGLGKFINNSGNEASSPITAYCHISIENAKLGYILGMTQGWGNVQNIIIFKNGSTVIGYTENSNNGVQYNYYGGYQAFSIPANTTDVYVNITLGSQNNVKLYISSEEETKSDILSFNKYLDTNLVSPIECKQAWNREQGYKYYNDVRSCYPIKVQEGEMYKYSGWSTAQLGPTSISSVYVFLDEDWNFVSYSGSGTDDTTITIPSGVEWMILCKIADTAPVLTKIRLIENERRLINDAVLPASSLWNNVKWVALGDSITADAHPVKSYWKESVANALKMTMYNCGIGSTCLGIKGDYSLDNRAMCTDTRLNEVKSYNPSLVTLQGGTNDCAQSIPLGTNDEFAKSLAQKDKQTFKGAMSFIIETLLTWKPSLRLLVLTANFGDGDDGASLSTIGLTFADYAYAMTEVAKYYGIPFVDLHSEQGINAITASYYTSDGIHWNQIGGQVAASLIISKLQNINNAI